MQDSAETAIVLLTLIVAGGAAALKYLLSIDAAYLAEISFLLMWLYSIFWAFNFRWLLSAHLYRNQALGVGLVAIGWAAFDYSFLAPIVALPDTAFSVALLLTFYWVDASILVGRKSDPGYRDTFHWRKMRTALWPIVVAVTIVQFVGYLSYPSGFLLLVPNGVRGNPSPLALLLFLIIFLAIFVPGPVSLLATAFRSRDTILRRHLKWFGLFAASLSAFFFAAVAAGEPLLIAIAYLVGTYCL